MKVSSSGGPRGVDAGKRAKKVSGGGGAAFADQLREAAGSDTSFAAVDTSAVAGVDSLISIQEAGDATQERQRKMARQYGDDLLDRLEKIRADLLVGAIPKERLANLAQSMRAQRRRSDDPRLNSILEEIELRAEVEIAKLTRTY